MPTKFGTPGRPLPPRAVLREAQVMWERGDPTHEIVAFLGFQERWELYQLRAFCKWAPRITPVGTVVGRPRMTLVYSDAELGQAERMWYDLAPIKDIMRVLHLEHREHVYVVAKRHGWTPRRQPRNKEYLRRRILGLPPAPPARHRRKATTKQPRRTRRYAIERPTDEHLATLPHVCARCHTRVGEGYGVTIEGETYHQGCAPKQVA